MTPSTCPPPSRACAGVLQGCQPHPVSLAHLLARRGGRPHSPAAALHRPGQQLCVGRRLYRPLLQLQARGLGQQRGSLSSRLKRAGQRSWAEGNAATWAQAAPRPGTRRERGVASSLGPRVPPPAPPDVGTQSFSVAPLRRPTSANAMHLALPRAASRSRSSTSPLKSQVRGGLSGGGKGDGQQAGHAAGTGLALFGKARKRPFWLPQAKLPQRCTHAPPCMPHVPAKQLAAVRARPASGPAACSQGVWPGGSRPAPSRPMLSRSGCHVVCQPAHQHDVHAHRLPGGRKRTQLAALRRGRGGGCGRGGGAAGRVRAAPAGCGLAGAERGGGGQPGPAAQPRERRQWGAV